MRDAATLFKLADPLLHLSDDVEVIEHILQRAGVRKALEQSADCLFGFHRGTSSMIRQGS